MTAKSRYLASIGQHQTHHYRDPTMDISLSLDDPPPPPPNPPSKRGVIGVSSSSNLKTRRASSAATSRTSSMSNSSSGEIGTGARVNSKSSSSHGDIGYDSAPPSSISVASGGAVSINYDDILNEEKSSASVESNSLSSGDSGKKGRSGGGYKKKPTPETQTTNIRSRNQINESGGRSTKSSGSRKKQNHYDGVSVGSESYSTIGISLDSVLSPPPPPPPGTPPNSSSKKYSSSAGKSVKSSKSAYSGYSSRSGSGAGASADRSDAYSQRSGKKSQFHTEEFSNVDFDLDELHSETSKSTNLKSVKSRQNHSISTASKSKSRGSGYNLYDDIAYDDDDHDDSHDDHETADAKSKSRDNSRMYDHDIEENDSASVETEVLRYGEVNEAKSTMQETVRSDIQSKSTVGIESLQSVDSSVPASEKHLSVAEKRRRKALANANSTPSKDNEADTLSKNATSVLNISEKNLSVDKEDDPPLVLEDSDYDVDMSEDEREDRAIKKKKKKGGFFKKLFVSSIIDRLVSDYYF